MRDAVHRVVRAGRSGWVALALHLSRLPAPAPRPYHRRIARVILDDAAGREDGGVFPLGNGDMVLLWRAGDSGSALAGALARLFQVDVPDADVLLTRWLLPEEGEPFLSYVDFTEQHATARPPPAAAEATAAVSVVETVSSLVESGNIGEVLHRQTAVLFPSGTARLQPLYRELTFSVALLEARVQAAGHLTADPFLFRHLASRFDARMLQTLADDLRSSGALTAWASGNGPALHLNLTPSAILSPAFAAFAAACRTTQARIGVEIALLDACADPEAFVLARELVREAGLTLVLDAVSHQALLIASPAAFEPDLVKLEWSRVAPEADPALQQALGRIGRDRVVLHRADTEEALRWGLRSGIRRFQGRHVDAILAASRIEACTHATNCTLRQCMERESAASNAGRIGCRNLGLLDAAAPIMRVPA